MLEHGFEVALKSSFKKKENYIFHWREVFGTRLIGKPKNRRRDHHKTVAVASCCRASLNFLSMAGQSCGHSSCCREDLQADFQQLGWFRVPKRCAAVYHMSCVAQNVGVAHKRIQHKKITAHPQEAQGGSIGLSVCCKKDKRTKIKCYSLPVVLLRWMFYSRLEHAAQRLLSFPMAELWSSSLWKKCSLF